MLKQSFPTLLDDSLVSVTLRYVLSEAGPDVASMKTTLSASSFSTAKWMLFVAPEPPLLTVMAWLIWNIFDTVSDAVDAR